MGTPSRDHGEPEFSPHEGLQAINPSPENAASQNPAGAGCRNQQNMHFKPGFH